MFAVVMAQLILEFKKPIYKYLHWKGSMVVITNGLAIMLFQLVAAMLPKL